MMRIAIVASQAPTEAEPYTGNPISQTALALQRFAEVEVFYTQPSFPRWQIFQPRKFLYSRVDSRYFPPGLRAEDIHFPAFPLVGRPFIGRTCFRYLLPRLQKSQPELILAYWLYPSGYGALLAGEEMGIPVILGVRGSDLLAKPDVLTRGLRRTALRRASFVLTVSDELRQRAIRFGAPSERARTIPNGCDSSMFQVRDRQRAREQQGVLQDTQLVLFVGRLNQVKGIGDLIAATGRLVPSHPRLEVVLIGGGVLEGELRARTERAGLAGHIRFLGRQAQQVVARWLAAADVLCLPSYSEGCPNVLLEALSCGRPVVASHLGGVAELVDSNCSILFPPGDPVKLAEALAEALRRPWDAASIAARSRRTWEDVGRETYEACSAVLEKHSAEDCKNGSKSSRNHKVELEASR